MAAGCLEHVFVITLLLVLGPGAHADAPGNSTRGPVQSHKSPFKPKPIYDPTGESSELCEDYECHTQTDCDTDRLCQLYRPCDSHRVCLHKALWPMLGKDVLFFFVLFIIAILAGATGIGGGGINVPLLIFLNAFDVKEAVPLSHVAVMGNALSQLVINTQQRHPSSPVRPLIHYEIAFLLLPAQLGGNSLGVVVGRVFPPTMLIVLSLVLLALASLKTAHKGFKVLKEQRSTQVKPPSLGTGVSMSSPPDGSTIPAESEAEGGVGAATDDGAARGNRGAREAPLLHDRLASHSVPADGQDAGPGIRMRTPWKVIGYMLIFNIVFCLDYLAISKDASHYLLGFTVERCSATYWVALLGLYPFIFASLTVGMQSMRTLATWHAERQDPPVDGDPVVSVPFVCLFAVIAVLIGLVAGLLGLGGGEFMVPLLLEFGLPPRVAAATSGFLMVFTTSSNVAHYLIAGTIEPFLGYGIACFLCALVGAFIGVFLRDSKWMMERSYILVFLIAGVLFSSGILLGLRGFDKISWDFQPFCTD